MKTKILLLIAVIGCLTSCANKSTFTSFSSLADYNYAMIDDSKDNGGDASLMNFKVQLQQALQGTRIKEISPKEAENLSESERKQLVILQLTGSQTKENSVATINVSDYNTGKVLGSCNGIFGLGFSTYGDMNGAIKKAVRAFIRMVERDTK